MVINCKKCKTSFSFDEKLIKAEGSKVRCTRCGNIFKIYPQKPQEPDEIKGYPQEPQKPAEIKGYPQKPEEPSEIKGYPQEPEEPAEISDETIFVGHPAADLPRVPEMNSSKPEHPPLPRHIPMTPPLKGEENISVTQKKITGELGDKKYGVKKYMTFKQKLILFALSIIAIIALIVLPIELYRPMQTLHEFIANARNLIGGVQAGFLPEELDRMNRFTLDLIDNHRKADKIKNIPEIYISMAFNMILSEGGILPELQVQDAVDQAGLFSTEKFEYGKLLEAEKYWMQKFSEDTGILEIMKRYKAALIKAKQNAREAGFSLSEIMIMIDTGKKEGFFKDNIAFVMESVSWLEAQTYAGQPYPVPPELEYWRTTALNGKGGYDNCSTSDPERYYLPRFDKDEWGIWFSVWLTRETKGIFNIFSIDFNADRVKKMLLNVTGIVAGVIILEAILVLTIATILSRRVTRPISELIKGANQVANGNYDYVVKVIKQDEFGELTIHFNQMTKGQKERLNLMQTLEKFLSKELAEKASKEGIVLGGQKTNCTIMFTDFAGFSTITQHMNASEAVNILNFYFNALIPIIKKYGGFPDKFIGDAIVAIFGAPVRMDNNAERAVCCAIEMQRKLREINELRRKQSRVTFEMRIGLNSGEVIVGAIGCDMKLEYTSIGETTNLANRMESICNIGHVAIAQGTYSQIKDTFFKGVYISETPQKVQVKGYPEPVFTYSVNIDNIVIEKNIGKSTPKNFYIYKHTTLAIPQSPEQLQGKTFKSEAAFL